MVPEEYRVCANKSLVDTLRAEYFVENLDSLSKPDDVEVYWTNPLGKHPDVNILDPLNYQSWKVEGLIRKIHIKSRLWDERPIIQGIQVFLIDSLRNKDSQDA